jgi:hypothetical protein
MRGAIFLLFLTLLSIGSAGQPAISWEKAFGGSEVDRLRKVSYTGDGDILLNGTSTSIDFDIPRNQGLEDAWIALADASGNLIWSKTYGGSAEDFCNYVIETADGGYIAVGATHSNDGDVTSHIGEYDCWAMKLDANGDLEWEKTYGGTFDESFYRVMQMDDEGYLFMGWTSSFNGSVSSPKGSSDIWLVRTNKFGTILWNRNFGGPGAEGGYDMLLTKDSTLVICGNTSSSSGDVSANFGSSDIWVIQVDLSGNLIWESNFGGSDLEIAMSVEPHGNGFLVLGHTKSNDQQVTYHAGGDYDMWLIKIDSSGNFAWQKSYGGTENDYGADLYYAGYGRSFVLGTTNSQDTTRTGQFDIWLQEITDFGVARWQKMVGGNSSDVANSLIADKSGALMIGATTWSSDLNVKGNHGLIDGWVVQLEEVVSAPVIPEPTGNLAIFPNPAKDVWTMKYDLRQAGEVELQVHDLMGRLVESHGQGNRSIGIHEFTLHGSDPGVYLIDLVQNGQVLATTKLVVIF